MNTENLEKRIKELELELEQLKSSKIAENLQREISFRQAIEKLNPNGIAIVDDTGKQIYVNPAFCELLGWEMHEVLGPAPFVYWPSQEMDNINQAFILAMQNQAPKEGFDLMFLHKSGRLVPVQVIVSPFVQEDNKVFWSAIVIDITNRKQTELALTKSQSKLLEAQKIGNIGHWEYDIINDKISWSEQTYQIYGVNPESFEPIFADVLALFHPEDRDWVEIAYQTCLKDKTDLNIEHRVVTSNNEIKYVAQRAVIKYNDKGDAIEIFGSIADITERKLAELIIQKQNESLQELNATKDKFFSIIGHDLRGPVGSFRSLLNIMLSNYDLTDTNNLIKVLKSAQKLADATYTLLDNLLLWAKSQRNEIIFTPQEINLKELTDSTIELFTELINHKNIKVNNYISPATLAFADKNMLMTILRNLISNAIKFTPRGRMIHLSAQEIDNHLFITVKDEGLGISLDNQVKLFKNTEHVSTYGTENEKGSGIGLLLCKDFVEKHQGTIWVESTLNQGSSFIFTLTRQKSI